MAKPVPLDPSFRNYLKRLFHQFKKDVRAEVVAAVIAIIAIIIVLLMQYWFGWIKTGEGWQAIILNVSPSVGILVLYLAYHLIRAPHKLDIDRYRIIEMQAADITKLKEAADKSKPNFSSSMFEQSARG